MTLIKPLAVRGLLVVCCGALVMGQGCPTIPLSEDSRTLIQIASTSVKLFDPDAIVFSVDGVNGGTFGGTDSITLEWKFLATNPETSETTWQLTYTGMIWTTEVLESPLLGVEYYDLTEVGMTLIQAKTILMMAGHAMDFYGWNLYKPLHPDFPDPLFAFNYSDKGVTINARTGAVGVPVYEEPVTFGSPPGEDSVSRQMIQAANDAVKEGARSAYIIWAGGNSGTGEPMNEPSDTAVFDFLAVAPDTFEVPSWRLHYDGEFAVTQTNEPVFGIEFLDLTTVGMDVVEAWGIVVDAGYLPPFAWWELFKPLNPNVPNPLFVFPIPAGFVLVDTVTGEIFQERAGDYAN